MTTKMLAVQASCLLLAATSPRSTQGDDGNAGAKESSMVFTGSVAQVGLAITKAFGNGVYHCKYLFALPYDFVVRGRERIAVPLTNAWALSVPDQGRLPLTLVPSGKSMAAYDENFFIKADPIAAGSTRVTVRSEGSGVTEDKYDRSPHLALVLRESYHPPIPSETTNLFWRIERQLREMQAGRTNALPPTADTAPAFYSHFWRDMDVKQKHDPDNWKKMVQAWKALQAAEPTPSKANAPGGIVH